MADIEIEIDGQKLTARADQTIIQVADAAGIYIPRFCYHKHLSVAANCRMCLVDVEKSPKTLPACATPVMPGMKVFTKSQKTIEAQRAVMEFLLINHPLDCPICDQGGECELQDLAMGYGSSHSHYDECKRATPDHDLGPLIESEMTRCIYCTRCVRFGDEIAGMREMGGTYRGEHTEIGTYVQKAIKSEVSGNIIDLCPVGALTSKPFRFRARAWELDQAPSIAPHDCLGSNIYVHTRYGSVMRVVSRENKAINETWLSDRDRFSYAGLYHADRIKEPMIKKNGKWQVVSWQKALETVASGLQEAISKFGSDQLGALSSPNATVEEFYLLQKIVRSLGSTHIDYRLREKDTRDQAHMAAFPGLDISISELEQCDAMLLIGSNVQKEQPLASLRIRKAGLKGAAILAINPMDYRFNFPVAAKKIVSPSHMLRAMASLVNAIKPEFDVDVDETSARMAEQLQGKQKICIMLGALALHHPQASAIRYLAGRLAELTGAKIGYMTDGANAAGAWLAGAIPHRLAGGITINQPGLNAYDMLEKARKAYILLNVEPDVDCANSALAIDALKQAKFVVALSTYQNATIDEYAQVILPVAPFTETSGTFVNVNGEWQSFTGVAKAYGSSRPAWKVLRVIGNFLHLDGFAYESSEDIKHEVKAIVEKMPTISAKFSRPDNVSFDVASSLTRIGEIPIYAVDGLVRRSQPLQETQPLMEGEFAMLRIHPETAKKLNLQSTDIVAIKQHGNDIQLGLTLDERVSKDAVWLAGGISVTSGLGDLFGEIEIHKI